MIVRRLLTLMAAVGFLSLLGCCGAPAKLYVFWGALTEAECKALATKFHDHPHLVVACPGDTVTLYWEGAVETIDEGTGAGPVKVPASPGSKQIVVNNSIEIVTQPSMKDKECHSVKASIDVAVGDIPFEVEARWDIATGKIVAYVPQEFLSPKLRAVDITGDKNLNYIGGTSDLCYARPVLTGNHVEEVYVFPMNTAEITHHFSRQLRPAGNWEFISHCVANKPKVEDQWANDATYLFHLTLRCGP